MKTTLSNSQVIDTLLDHEVLGQRTTDGVIEATRSLVEWLEDLEDSTGQEMELDPIALRCEFSLVTTDEAAEMYDIDTSGVGADDRAEAITNYLNDNTIVIPVDDTNLIIAEF
jgi:hypothetical protein